MRRRGRWRYGLAGVGLIGIIAITAMAFPGLNRHFLKKRARASLERLSTATVRRSDLWVTVTASGLVGSADQTTIECELEALDAGVNGQRLRTSGTSTILKLIPAGTMVKKDDVLCELDSSAYVELVRQQEMTVQRATADHLQAKLTYEVAVESLREFRDGNLMQTKQQLDGSVAMASSDLERVADRLRWSKRMLQKGYASVGQVSNESIAQQKAEFKLSQSRMSVELFKKYEIPGTIRQLENNVESAKTMLTYQTNRLQRQTDRLARYRRQVERCTIKAPHDGFVIYADDARRQIVIEEGMEVYQGQKLFYLPDLAKMEVSTLLHESVVSQVKEGMRAKIQVESLPNHTLEGHVISVASLPTKNFFSEVTYYTTLVKIDNIPGGLRPGMSAAVEITTGHKTDALTIPAEAMTVEDGHEICYVTEGDSLQRREIKTAHGTQARLEVTEGLSEGERVVLDPSSIGPEVVAELGTSTPASPEVTESPETPDQDVTR